MVCSFSRRMLSISSISSPLSRLAASLTSCCWALSRAAVAGVAADWQTGQIEGAGFDVVGVDGVEQFADEMAEFDAFAAASRAGAGRRCRAACRGGPAGRPAMKRCLRRWRPS
jgi:hypothetical protein